MPNYICVQCGVQYAESNTPPELCAICSDERQYINPNGQQWTTLEALQADHQNTFVEIEPGYTSIRTEPQVAIGEQANLIHTPQGNVLWDCISTVDDATVAEINKRGGLTAIAISHPHFYGAVVSWSHAFGSVPVYLHADDRQWMMRPDPVINFWEGETLKLNDTITVIRCGGHFDGSSALHWAAGAEGRGVLMSADTLYIAEDRKYVTFAYSFPNRLPLNVKKVRRIGESVQPFQFDRIYDGWRGKIIASGAKEVVKKSVERYIKLISD